MTDLFLYIGGIIFIIDMLFISVKNQNKEFTIPVFLHWTEGIFWAFSKFSSWISVFELVWIIFGIMSPFAFYFWAILFLNMLSIYGSVTDAGKLLFWINNGVKILIVLLVFFLNYVML